jgi:oligoendopeptidase F
MQPAATATVPPRSEVPVEYTWDTASVFPSDAEWQQELHRLAENLPEIQQFSGRLGDSPSTLVEWMETMQSTSQRLGRLYVYAAMFHEADTSDQSAKAKYDQVTSLFGRASAALAFAEPELLALGADKLHQMIEQEPRLAAYKHYFDDLYSRQAHVRSAEVEEVLGLVGEPFFSASSTSGILVDADLTFAPATSSGGEEIPVAQGNLDSLVHSDDREVRRTAWESYADSHLAFKNTLANALATAIKQNVFMARARRYDSALEAALAPNNIPTEVFHNLINTYKQNLPTWHRYWAILRRALGYDTLHVYDIKAPLVKERPYVPYSQASEWIAEGMKPLGGRYGEVMQRGLQEQRWVDVYPNQGKRQGAFSMGWQGTHPFILMSYDDSLESMSTLAHELGHSMHSYFSWDTQPQVYAQYSMFVAEVASNFNQALVRDYLFKTNSDPNFQIALLSEAMSNFHRYFFIMPTLARFELELHERVERGEGLTADGMIKLMADLFGEGYGGEVEMDEQRVGITWAQFQHLYANFYVFQYATGISGAHALAAGVLAGEQDAADKYIRFLSAGSSVYPIDALKLAGVDLTTPEAVERTFDVLKQMVDRLETLVEQR